MQFEPSNISQKRSNEENIMIAKSQFEMLSDNLNYLVARIEGLEVRISKLESEGR